ncbi:hypothetical protein BH11PLA2_BH11PLA2_19080 [soil metagenome]
MRVFDTTSILANPATPVLLFDFFAGNTANRSGIRVNVTQVDGDATADIVTGEGFGRQTRIRSFSGATVSAPLTPTEINNSFVDFDNLSSLNGAWVGSRAVLRRDSCKPPVADPGEVFGTAAA